jgi:hypothetical protein
MKIFSAHNHFVLFEILSIIATVWTLFIILGYSFFYKFNSGISRKNFGVVKIYFTTDIENPTINSDIKILVKDIELIENHNSIRDFNYSSNNNTQEGYIIVNKKNFNDCHNSSQFLENGYTHNSIDRKHRNKTELIALLNNNKIEEAYIFKDSRSLSHGHSLLNQYSKYVSDFFNFIYFDFLFLFFTFMKVTISRQNFILFKKWRYRSSQNHKNYLNHVDDTQINRKIPEQIDDPACSLFSKRFFYSSIFFNLSVVLIIPILYSNYSDLRMDLFLGFKRNYFNSFIFDRNFLYSGQSSNLNVYVDMKNLEDEKFIYKNNYFLMHSANILTYCDYNYVTNILFLSLVVWISSFFHETIFEKGNFENSKNQNDNKFPKKFREILTAIVMVVLMMSWCSLLVLGILNSVDVLHFYHLIIFRNFDKIFDWVIGSFLLLFYLHLYLYVFMIFYSIRLKIKERRGVKSEREMMMDRDFRNENNLKSSSSMDFFYHSYRAINP